MDNNRGAYCSPVSVALIITQGTSQPNAAKIKEATKIIAQRKPEELTNKSSKI